VYHLIVRKNVTSVFKRLNKGDYEYALSGIGTTIAHRGGVINLASTAAFQPLAGATVYAASKAFVLFFTEGLALELERSGVKVTAACPGPAATQFFVNMNPKQQAKQMDQLGPVVSEILRGFERGRKDHVSNINSFRLPKLL
jgi:short-subunit dehydrogenase